MSAVPVPRGSTDRVWHSIVAEVRSAAERTGLGVEAVPDDVLAAGVARLRVAVLVTRRADASTGG